MVLGIGILTGGGDCPGLNGLIRAVVRSGLPYGYRTLGIRNGWQGLMKGDVELLTDSSVSGIISRGGTVLGTSRTDPLKNPADFKKIQNTLKKFQIGALVVAGGDGTLAAAHQVAARGAPGRRPRRPARRRTQDHRQRHPADRYDNRV